MKQSGALEAYSASSHLKPDITIRAICARHVSGPASSPLEMERLLRMREDAQGRSLPKETAIESRGLLCASFQRFWQKEETHETEDRVLCG